MVPTEHDMVPAEFLRAAQAQAEALGRRVEQLMAELAAERETAAAERAKLQLTVDALLAKIEELLAKKNRKKATDTPAEPPPAPPDPEALANRPRPPAAPPKPERPPRPARRTKPPRPTLVTITEVVRPKACAHCQGENLLAKDTRKRTLINWVTGYIEQRIVAATRCTCMDCGKTTPAPFPGACLPKTQFTAAFAANILYCKYMLHLPWERISGDIRRQGYPLAPSSVSDLGQRSLDELMPIAKVIWALVRALPYNHSDATGMPVLMPGAKKTHLGQMFFFGWGKLAAFRYAKDKEASTFARLIGDFEGTMVLDASSTHNDALATARVRWAGCNAHGLRKFREAKGSDPIFGAEGERWISAWFDKEREARERGLEGAELLAWRKKHIAPLVQAFKRWLALVHPTTLPKSTLAEATRYYVNHWRALTAFLRDPNVPLENNFAERNLRVQAVGRSNWLFAGTHEAAENAAVAYTLVNTAKLHGLDPRAYLTWALERVAAGRKDRTLYARLTPMAYQEAQQIQGA